MGTAISVKPLPSRDHVARHCNVNMLIQNPDPTDPTDIYSGVNGEAFNSSKDIDGISVLWVEHIHHHNKSLPDVMKCLNKNRSVKRSHRLAVIGVQTIINCGSKLGENLVVCSDPLSNYDCHSLIVGINPDLPELFDLIASEVLSIEVAHIE